MTLHLQGGRPGRPSTHASTPPTLDSRTVWPTVAGPARLVPLAALMDQEFSIAALRQAAQGGRLDAMQGPDGIWRSSRQAVDAYRATRMRRRP